MGEEIEGLRALGGVGRQKRFRDLGVSIVLGREVAVATSLRARLLGLAYLDRCEAGQGLLIPRCSSVHTFGMRFALDLYWLDEAGEPIQAHRSLPPRRLANCRGAAAVLEVPAVEGGEIPTPKP